MNHILATLATVTSIIKLVRSVVVLDAIYLITTAWNKVSSEALKNNLGKSGFRYTLDSATDEYDADDDVSLSVLANM